MKINYQVIIAYHCILNFSLGLGNEVDFNVNYNFRFLRS